MKIGIPKEIKPLEGRVGLVPEACAELVALGHRVFLERDAGNASGSRDEDYRARGVEILADAGSVYAEAELVVKVKEPVGPELEMLQAGHRLFSFLHLAANPALLRKLLDIGLTAVAFETDGSRRGELHPGLEHLAVARGHGHAALDRHHDLVPPLGAVMLQVLVGPGEGVVPALELGAPDVDAAVGVGGGAELELEDEILGELAGGPELLNLPVLGASSGPLPCPLPRSGGSPIQ